MRSVRSTGVSGAMLALFAAHSRAKRRVREARTTPDHGVLGSVPEATREQRVQTSDGATLQVWEYGDPGSPTTVVLTHGWTLSGELWSQQVSALSKHARVVVYDHRGHGRSDRTPDDSCSLDQLGADLGSVIDAVAPWGSLVLAGHSMGGMTLMHLAAQRPSLFAERVRGVVLVSTSAGELSQLDLGLPRPLGALVRRFGARGISALGRLERRVEGRWVAPPEVWLAVRHLNFGPGAPARHVDEMLRVVSRTPLGVVSAFYAALLAHDGACGLPVLSTVPVTIVVGGEDRLTPPEHSYRLARGLPDAEFRVVPGAGHMLTLERPEQVSEAISAYCDSAASDSRNHLLSSAG